MNLYEIALWSVVRVVKESWIISAECLGMKPDWRSTGWLAASLLT
jgi:hypothetical protein